MRCLVSNISQDAAMRVAMITGVAFIPFLLARTEFLNQSHGITYLLVPASFGPWVLWWRKASKLLQHRVGVMEANKTNKILGLMLITCVLCNSWLLWIVFMSCVLFEHVSDMCAMLILLAASVLFLLGSVFVVQLSRKCSNSPKVIVPAAALLLLGLVAPLLGVILGAVSIYAHGKIMLYQWFFAQSLGYAAAFYGLTILAENQASDKHPTAV